MRESVFDWLTSRDEYGKTVVCPHCKAVYASEYEPNRCSRCGWKPGDEVENENEIDNTEREN